MSQESAAYEEITDLREENTYLKDLVYNLELYIKLLGKELDEVVPLATSHGWNSTRYESGKVARKNIDDIKAKLSKC